jgi:hypothetical protein
MNDIQKDAREAHEALQRAESAADSIRTVLAGWRTKKALQEALATAVAEAKAAQARIDELMVEWAFHMTPEPPA